MDAIRRFAASNAKAVPEQAEGTIETDIPSRLDRLPWGRFHTYVVVALGVTWALNGLEVTLAGAVAGALKSSPVLHLSDGDVGLSASCYIAGLALGGLLFGWATDRLGRRLLFFVTLALYIAAAAATGLAWDLVSFATFRFLTGAAVGGECTAINSAIQELVPARARGRTDLAVNGSFWVGAFIGAAGSASLLDPALLPGDFGWRACFLIGAVLATGILLMRLWVPESPRWLMTHGRVTEAEAIVQDIERHLDLPSPAGRPIRLRAHRLVGVRDLAHVLFVLHRRRALVVLCLMTAQAFFYNAIFFTYALVLNDFYGVAPEQVGWYIMPFAIGNFLGPVLLGRLFDTLGRRTMISATYTVSGLLLAATGAAFVAGDLTAVTQTTAWSVVFFFASAAASSAYLTMGETFPLEVRATAIAVFFALGTGIGGIVAPWLLSWLIATGSRTAVFAGYLGGSVLMLAAAGVQAVWGADAERRSLEQVARPLSEIE